MQYKSPGKVKILGIKDCGIPLCLVLDIFKKFIPTT
jgi:hypothetical protein